MYRGFHHHGGGRFDYGRRGPPSNDMVIELIQEFRGLKPYLQKFRKFIMESKTKEEYLEDILFYLDVSKDIMADETHGVDQLRGYIDKIHDMIRKNPLTELPGRGRSMDAVDEEFGDDDRPRSPSPGARGSDSATNNIPLIPTHGAHRTVNVDFTSPSQSSASANDDSFDEWGRPNYTRHETFKDVDMRNSYYNPSSSGASDIGQRRWSGESDFSGAHGMGRGIGRGMGRGNLMHHRNEEFRPDYEHRGGRGRPLHEKEFVRPPDWFQLDRNRSSDVNNRTFKPPEWLTREDPPPSHNGNVSGDGWQQPKDTDGGFRGDFDRNRRENKEDWRRNTPAEEERIKYLKQIEQNFERRPTSDSRHETDDASSTFERRRRNDEERQRSHMEVGSAYSSSTSRINYPAQSHSMPYGVSPKPGHYSNQGLLPTPSYSGGNQSHHPNAPIGRMGIGMQSAKPPIARGVNRPMNYQPYGNFNRPGTMASTSNYRIPPPTMPSITVPPRAPPSSTTQHASDQFQGFSTYNSSVERSAEEIRDISTAKAKNCFQRIANRITGSGTHSASSTMTSVSPGPASPTSTPNDHQGSSLHGALDPRLNRGSKPGAVHNHQTSPPISSHSKPSTSTRTDAGNVLRPSMDPRARSKQDEERRKMLQVRDRVKHDLARPYNKPSKLQELRKQIEKEGLFRLGRPTPKKQSGTFEEALSSCDTVEKATDKSKTPQSKEKDNEEERLQRSHSDKTEREKSPRRADEKGRSKSKSKSKERERKSDKEGHREKGKRTDHSSKKLKKSSQGTSDASSSRNLALNASDKSTSSEKNKPTADPHKLPAFKIPRKPKPKQPDTSEQPASTSSRSASVDKDDSSTAGSLPGSPEPALSEVPQADRNNSENEPSTSSKAATQGSSSSSGENPDAMEFLRQFLMTSASPADRDYFLSDPANLKGIFSKIMTEISSAKGKSSEESTSTRPSDADSESDKNQAADEEVHERGRSRERKRNTKRRSSLEKLHDALKEMRFDKMLPLGPRRCTRSETVSETTEGSDAAVSEVDSVEQASTPIVAEIVLEEKEEIFQPAIKKRGRPPKQTKSPPGVVNQKAKKGAKVSKASKSTIASEESETPETPQSFVQKGKGKKRKLKSAKPTVRKRAKKTGPVTRAQAALKKPKSPPVSPEEGLLQNKSSQDVPQARKRRTTTMILRRLNRRTNTVTSASYETVVNKDEGKIKIEGCLATNSNMKSDPLELDPLAAGDEGDIFSSFDPALLPEHFTQMIDEHLNDEAFANLEKQTEDNMDLTVFNSLDTDEQVAQVIVKHEIDLGIDEGPSAELSYENIINGSPSKRKSGRLSASIATPPKADSSDDSINQKDTQEEDLLSTANNLNMATDTTVLEATSATTTSAESSSHYQSQPTDSTDTSTPSAEAIVKHEADGNLLVEPSSPLSSNKDVKKSSTESFMSDSFFAITLPQSSCSDSVSSTSLSLTPPKSAISDDVKETTDGVDVKLESQDIDDGRKIKCEICNFSGKKIVPHYVNKHYPCHIPQARLQKETFDGLVELNHSGSPQLLGITLDDSHAQVWPCLYCENRFSCIVDFYDHLTTHTGEFRFECAECNTSYPYQKSLVNHVKQHKGISKNCIRTVFNSGIEKTSTELSGFLCNDCFYFQLRFESIMRHIEQTGHNALEVKSVQLIGPSPVGSAVVSPSKSETGDAGEKSVKVPNMKGSNTESPDLKSDASVVEIKPAATSEVTTNRKVFFGTDVNFSPPSVSLNECTLRIQPVFQGGFLESLLRKVSAEDIPSSELTAEDEALKRDLESTSRKRKLSDSLLDEDTGEDSLGLGSIDGDSDSASDKDKNNEESEKSPRPSRVCILKKMRLRAKKRTLEMNSEEPNDFLCSSDESSESSGSDDSDDESDAAFGAIKAETEPEETSGFLRNNEHLVRTKEWIPEGEMNRYMEKRNLIAVRRPGDLHAPNTVLFGYIKPSALTGSTKLRDSKEVDRLGGVHGRRILPMKAVKNLTEMMAKEKLLHLFKCMATYCSYTTDDAGDFETHLTMVHDPAPFATETCVRLSADFADVRTLKDWDCCSYCSARYKYPKDLVIHVANQHSQSLYQCNKCFYRSFYHRYVVRHFDLEHPQESIQVLKCHRKILASTLEATLFQIFVYKCNIDNPNCNKQKRFVFREDYLEHLENCAPRQDLYTCHLCPTSVIYEELIEHYKVHNLFKFHCSYCQYGSEVKTDLDEHFVHVHPNTSGRVFYRVKPIGDNPCSTVVSVGRSPFKMSPSKGKVVEEHTDGSKTDDNKTDWESSGNADKESVPNFDTGGADDEDSEKGRVTNLKGRDLFRCVTGECDFAAEDSESFKDHVTNCPLVADSRSLACAHCERKLKTVTNLLEHMRVHGEKKQICSICSFRCWTSTEITKHIKTIHRVMSYKLIKKVPTESDTDPDVVAFPKDVFVKSLCDVENFENNYYCFTRKAVYSFENIDKLPTSKVFSADLHCAMCPYSTKVRTNIIRHLGIHKQALEDGKTVVPQIPRINPVPYLSREGLEFDKMMNLAASSHKSDGGIATADEVRKLPQFVKEQFRYVCSVCDHITSDDSLLQTHIRVIHSEVTSYQCPHCQKTQESKDNPEYTVSLDKIAHHLRLHGPKLYKCGHCTVVHHQLRLMEKHIPEKHPEKKPIHYLIRDVDPDGVPSNRPTTSGLHRRQSLDDPKLLSVEKWKCFLCSSKSIFGSWDETKSHSEAVHKVNSQFMCLVCNFSSDDVTEMLTHCRENCKSEEKNKILVMFSKCEAFDGDESTTTAPVWKRIGGAVRHIHGNFTEDSLSLIKLYNSLLGSEQVPVASSPTRGVTSMSISSKAPMRSTTSSTTKARRSVGGSVVTKPGSPVKNIIPIPPSTLPKADMFKFRCHKCDFTYKTTNPNELRVHLFNEFRYKRWKCLTCSTTFTTEKSLKGHIERDHEKIFSEDLYELQPKIPEIEAEIDECIERQKRKRELINSFAVERQGKLYCKYCKDEEGLTYDNFETHILKSHSS